MYDILIKNGRTPSRETIDIAIQADKIAEIGSNLEVEAQRVIDLHGDSYVSAGWIDDHVHCYEEMDLYYDSPDEQGYKAGVTTIIDAGSTGAENMDRFQQLLKDVKTNVFAMINISKSGIVRQDELSDMRNIQAELVREKVKAFPAFIVGLKARMSKTVVGDNDILPLEEAKKIQQQVDLPLMVHIGSNPPTLETILAELEQGDIVTHCFNGKANGIFDKDNHSIKNFAKEAYEKGIIFDVGHGTDSFNFDVAEAAKAEHITPYTISTDLYHRNRESGPVYDMATTLEKLLAVGYSLAEIIPMVTSHPAASFKLKGKGELKKGADADITIFNVGSGSKELVDSNGNTRTINQLIKPTTAIIGGAIYDI